MLKNKSNHRIILILACFIFTILFCKNSIADELFGLPVNESSFTVSQYYGHEYSPGLYHAGVDYSSSDSSIYAVASGYVVKKVPNDGAGCTEICAGGGHGCTDCGFGNSLTIQHTTPYKTTVYGLYGHLASFAPGINEGTYVNRGDVIGTMGGAGYGCDTYWPVHLHFEVKNFSDLHNPSGKCGYTLSYPPDTSGYHNPERYMFQRDSLEPDDTVATATESALGTCVLSYLSSYGDRDWFRVPVDQEGGLIIDLTSLPADYDLYLYDIDGSTLLDDSDESGTNPENISFFGFTQCGYYYIKVVGYQGASSSRDSYMLTLSWGGPIGDCSEKGSRGGKGECLPPSPPTGVHASRGDYSHKVHITWDSVVGATSYSVYRADYPAGTKTTLVSGHTSTNYDDISGVAGEIYCYWVKATSSYGTSDFSSYDTGYSSDYSPTIAITFPVSTETYTTTTSPITLAGTASDDTPVVRVEWSNDRGGSGVAAGTTNWTANGIGLLSGVNNITVKAYDEGGNFGTDSIAVTYGGGGSDITPPIVYINSPTIESTWATSENPFHLGGIASDDVGVIGVDYSIAEGGGGVAMGTTSWFVNNDIWLKEGENTITITAYDAAHNEGTDTLTVTHRDDTTPPEIYIQFPTSEATFSTTDSTINLTGIASDDLSVKNVTWQSSQGASGGAYGKTDWSIIGIDLAMGSNVITVTAHDTASLFATDTITITRLPPVTYYTLSVSKTGSGAITSSPTGISCGGDCSGDYASGTPVALAAAASSGSVFTQWSGDCSGSNPSCSLTMDSAKSATAKFIAGMTFPFTGQSVVENSTLFSHQHIIDLQNATDTIRSDFFGWGGYSWNHTTPPQSKGPILASYITKLRVAIEGIYQQLSRTIKWQKDPTIYSYPNDPVNATTLEAEHINELRRAIENIW